MEISLLVNFEQGYVVRLTPRDVRYLYDQLAALLEPEKSLIDPGYLNKTNHDWQDKAIENMEKYATNYKAKVPDCSTDCYLCQKQTDTEAKIAEESPETLREPCTCTEEICGCSREHLSTCPCIDCNRGYI